MIIIYCLKFVHAFEINGANQTHVVELPSRPTEEWYRRSVKI